MTSKHNNDILSRIHRSNVLGSTLINVEEFRFPVVQMTICLRKGAFFDPPNMSGLAYLTLEMLLRGNKKYDRLTWTGLFEELGTILFVDAGMDLMFIRMTALKEYLEKSLEIFLYAFRMPLFENTELDILRDETIADQNLICDDDDSLADLFLCRLLYNDHPYGKSVYGEKKDLKNIKREDIINFYQQNFIPSNLIFGFSGDIKHNKAQDYVEKCIGFLPKVSNNQKKIHLNSIKNVDRLKSDKCYITLVDKPHRTQTQLRLARLFCSDTYDDKLAFWLGNIAFGGTFSSPFSYHIRESRGFSYTASSSYNYHRRFSSPMVLRTAPSINNALDCLVLQKHLFEQFTQGVLSDEDIDKAKSYIIGCYPFSLVQADELLMSIILYESNRKGLNEFFHTIDRIEQFSNDKIREVIKKNYRSPLNIVMVVSADEISQSLYERFPDATIEKADYRFYL